MVKNKREKKPNITKKLGRTGPLVDVHRAEAYDVLQLMVENGQILGATKTQLQDKLGITRQTVAKYLEKIYASVPAAKIDNIKLNLQGSFNRMMRDGNKMLKAAGTNQTKVREAHEFQLKVIDKYTDFLERFHIKAKATEHHAHDILGLSDNLVKMREAHKKGADKKLIPKKE